MGTLKDPAGYLIIEEKKRGLTKKKKFMPKDARALQTKINLKFPEMQNNNARKTEDLRDRKKNDLRAVREQSGGSPLKEFEKQYEQTCNL